jgi:hypothetical protein
MSEAFAEQNTAEMTIQRRGEYWDTEREDEEGTAMKGENKITGGGCGAPPPVIVLCPLSHRL